MDFTNKENIEQFRKRVRQARRDGQIGFIAAARVNFWAGRRFDDYMAIALSELDEQEREAVELRGLIDWENFDVDKFKAILEAIAEFVKILVTLF